MNIIDSERSTGSQSRRNRVLAGVTFAMMASASSGALAQCLPSVTTSGTPIPNISSLAAPASSGAAALSGAIGSVNTAFLTQQGSAFVSAPANPAPDQPGGGVWARAVGGNVNLNTTSFSTGTTTIAATGAPYNVSTTQCASTHRQDFAGVQVGADIARLNWGGWNIHLGTTAGYLGARSTDSYQFSNSYDIPFFGTYIVATHGRFFADLMVRQEFYNVNLLNPGLLYFNQPVGAHGYSVAASAGYNFALQNNWFIEPSAGFIYSKTSVDSYTNAGTGLLAIGGTIGTNDVTSQIGRASLRVGTVLATPSVVWQPFASASVFHEFAGDITSNYTSFANNAFVGPAAINFNQTTTTSRVGTYAQYSLGIAAQLVNTGWLGFVRADYRNGSNIDGWTGNAGIRYQFSPDTVAAIMPTKVKAPAAFIAPTVWSGFYIGGFVGGAYGRTEIGYVGAPTQGSKPWVFGPLGGGQIGYNHQMNNWVFGVEGDIGAADIKGGRTAGNLTGLSAGGLPLAGPAGFSPAFFTLQDKTSWMATATARVGYAMGRTLYYVRGGGAFEDSTISANCVLGITATVPDGTRACINQAGALTNGYSTNTRTRTGWLIGFGTEFDLGRNWSAKTEYNYIDFGSRTSGASDGTTVFTDKASISQVKVGVNYRFSPTAVVAKY